jgi:ABC-type methionine transport system permease subunit
MSHGEMGFTALIIFVALNALNIRYKVINTTKQTPFVIATIALTLIISALFGTSCGNCGPYY